MKFITYIILFILVSNISNAQKIRFTDTSNLWYEFYGGIGYNGVYNYQYLKDTSVNGVLYRKTNIKSYTPIQYYLIREDTLTKQVYAFADTGDILLYDFSLNTGDTFFNQKGNYVVDSIGQVYFDSIAYKVFYFSGITRYIVIENIGCLDGLLYPILHYGYVEYYSYVTCFYNNGVKPSVTPAITYSPFSLLFDNDSSCRLSVGQLMGKEKKLTISPHPASATSIIHLPETIQEGSLTIANAYGQLVYKGNISGTDKVTLKDAPLQTGLYFYVIENRTSGDVYKGKLLYR